ncbi:hypothetical protein ACFO3K_01885 [Cellulomonas algicola]|uniref:hypothetical protein n=1 Tax=Cellulomonas algicola TaxID=2071633 RepID=UPI001C3F8B2F|nr:hypothetical protein [Cellulomonas algicola]
MIVALPRWPHARRRGLTDAFSESVRELWASLDALVVESVAALSVQHRVRDPKRPRFFPVTASVEGFEDLLGEGCVDGLLRTQVAMVRDCQPFHELEGDERVDPLRQGLALLLAWDNALDAGVLVDGWASPGAPQVQSDPSGDISVEAAPAGFVHDRRVLANFQIAGYTDAHKLQAEADTYIDLGYPASPVLAAPDPTLPAQLTLAFETVVRFAAQFTWLLGLVPGRRRVLLEHGRDATDWASLADESDDWAAPAAPPLGLSSVDDAGDARHLLVVTDEGIFQRKIPHATPLREHHRRGTAAEIATQDAAATWGMPDFVLSPLVEKKGAALREVSDGLLVVGSRGAIVQVKAREGEVGTPAREESWVRKKAAEGVRQVGGTARRLKADALTMVNGRGRPVLIDGAHISWVGVVVIEHPEPPDLDLDAVASVTPYVVLTRGDWEFLFDQLRSTHAVVGYLHRAAAVPGRIGDEPARYYRLAAADADASPGPVDPLISAGGVAASVPLLPTEPVTAGDAKASAVYRFILEDIATSPFDEAREDQRLTALATLDSLPVGYRTALGRLLLDNLELMRVPDPGNTRWRLRTYRAGAELNQMTFAVCSTHSRTTQTAFSWRVMLLHHELCELLNRTDLSTTGVMLTPRSDRAGEWDTTLIWAEGDLELTAEDIADYRRLWSGNHRVDTTD